MYSLPQKEIKSGASRIVECFFIFMLSQVLPTIVVCHWPCSERALHKKQILLISSPRHWASSQVRHSLKTKIASQEHLSNNHVFKSLWTFHDPYETPSFFLQRASRTQSDNKRQATEMGDTMAGHRLWLCSFWWQEVGWEEPSWTPELKDRHCLKFLFTSKLRRFDSRINKVLQKKALMLHFEAFLKYKPVPNKGASLW